MVRAEGDGEAVEALAEELFRLFPLPALTGNPSQRIEDAGKQVRRKAVTISRALQQVLEDIAGPCKVPLL